MTPAAITMIRRELELTNPNYREVGIACIAAFQDLEQRIASLERIADGRDPPPEQIDRSTIHYPDPPAIRTRVKKK
jgi:hypothetical protein